VKFSTVQYATGSYGNGIGGQKWRIKFGIGENYAWCWCPMTVRRTEMSEKPKAIALVGVCPHCGEPIEIVISKKQIKAIYKGFKLPVLQAQIQAEKTIEVEERGGEG